MMLGLDFGPQKNSMAPESSRLDVYHLVCANVIGNLIKNVHQMAV